MLDNETYLNKCASEIFFFYPSKSNAFCMFKNLVFEFVFIIKFLSQSKSCLIFILLNSYIQIILYLKKCKIKIPFDYSSLEKIRGKSLWSPYLNCHI